MGRDPKSSTDINHHAGTKSVSGHSAVKPSGQDVAASNSMLSSFVYGVPVSSQPHPESKEIKPISLHNLGKECLGMWMSAHEKATPAKDCADNGRNCLELKREIRDALICLCGCTVVCSHIHIIFHMLCFYVM